MVIGSLRCTDLIIWPSGRYSLRLKEHYHGIGTSGYTTKSLHLYGLENSRAFLLLELKGACRTCT